MPPQNQEQQRSQPVKPSPAGVDPYSDPVNYLKANGWKPLGNPEWPTCLWHDTSRPLFDSEEKIEIRAYFLRKKPNAKKGDAPIAVLDKVMVKDDDGQPRPVEQIRYTPAAEPVTLTEALRTQMEREHRKAVEATREEEQRRRKATAAAA